MGMLDTKVAVVTGGGRGIGRQHCLELARHGAAVVVNDPGVSVRGDESDESPADSVVAEIQEAKGTAIADRTSVTDWDACKGIIERAVDTFGRLDVVVNNAGIVRDRMITSTVEEDFDQVISVHLKGTYAMTKHACDHWRAVAKAGGQNTGRIINTTSAAGLWGNVGQSVYGSAKAGIAALTRITALEMGRYDVTANAISPLAITRMTGTIASIGNDAVDEQAFQPLHPRASSPIVAYLASEASSWITGQIIRVEGNVLKRFRTWSLAESAYAAKSGEWFDLEELHDGIRTLFEAFPIGLDTSAGILPS
jgi:NAD(P)-dependent dehydrogenase (short-subunit alcohol dehydrogenase family)